MSETVRPGEDGDLEAVGALADPARRAVYRIVVAAGEANRDQVADAAGVGRSLAAFHLDKLVAAGLLAVAFRRPAGRAGPGAGRPTKWYRRADGERAVTLPPRSYVDAARLLADVVERNGLEAEAYQVAEAAGAKSDVDGTVLEALAAKGYEPFDDDGVIRLRNCPFHALARDFPPLVCGMNLALLRGMLAARPDGADWTARLDARVDLCCVAVLPVVRQNDSKK